MDFEDLSIPTTDVDGELYMSVNAFLLRLWNASAGVYSEVSGLIENGSVDQEQATYCQGILDGWQQIGAMLAEAGILEEFSKELEDLDPSQA